MSDLYMSGATAELTTQLFYYLLLTAHICLFVDMSPLQKHPTCKFNYAVASTASALIPFVFMRLISFPTLMLKHAAGISVAVILSIVITLLIQQVIKVDIDF